jgi:hypothetical protein
MHEWWIIALYRHAESSFSTSLKSRAFDYL